MATKPSAYFTNLILPPGQIKAGLYSVLRDSILDGRLPAGTKLPSSRALAEMMAISRNSVLAALDRLIGEGYLFARQSSGTYVAHAIPDQFTHIQQDSEQVAKCCNATLHSNPHLSSLLSNWQQHFPVDHGKKLFKVGVGCVDLFPHPLWSKLLARAWRQTYHQLGQFRDPKGYLPLRQAISEYVRATRGLKCNEHQILIVSGIQQAIHLIAYALMQTHDGVCLDEPGYDAALHIFRSFGLRVHPITSDQEGMQVAEIDAHFPDSKLIYTAPSHQFPLGGTLSLARRLALLELASQQQKWIFEDDYNSEFRYGTHPIQALQGLDQDQRVIYAGTFSKMMFPEFRLGFMVVPEAIVELMSMAKFYTDTHSSYLDQVALAAFIQEGHYAKHVRKVRKACQERQACLIQCIEEHLADVLEVNPSDSGIHVVCWLKKPWTEVTLMELGKQAGLAVQPLSKYCQRPHEREAILLGFAAHNANEIVDGIQKLKASAQHHTLHVMQQ